MAPTTINARHCARICVLGLVICLMACQPQAYKAKTRPRAQPPARKPTKVTRPTLYVAINHLNLRSCPGIDCPKISSLGLNAEVEKMGEIKSWTQIRVKKNGATGYVSSRYLSPHPQKAAQFARKKPRKGKPPKASQPPEVAGGEGKAWPPNPEPAPPIPRVM
jgi:uncharacterized protein YgiM (DUF1202 family)